MKHDLRGIFDRLEKADFRFQDKLDRVLAPLFKHYFRCDIKGIHNIPSSKVLFVGNHNGLVTFEVMMLYYGWRQAFGATRRSVALVHDFIFKNKMIATIMKNVGGIPASPKVALEAFRRNYSVLVYPGGEKEAFRPYHERKQIRFFGRKGFIRLALEAGVPIVPVISVGAHESYIILDRGEKLAEKLGIKKYLRLSGVPLTVRSLLFFASLLTVPTLLPALLAPVLFASIFVPMPAKMTFYVLPPIDPFLLLDPTLSESENWDLIYHVVTEKMQKALEAAYEERTFPILG